MSCAAETDCIAGQVCGSDRLCAAPAIAGRCANQPDDGGTGRDAGVTDGKAPVDATPVGMPDAKPDAPPTTTLHLKVDGQGAIAVQGVGTCASGMPQNGDCSFTVTLGDDVSANAVPKPDWQFDKWTTAPCLTESSTTCNFTVIGPTEVRAKFRKDD